MAATLTAPKVKGNPNTLRAYTNVLDRVAEQLDTDRALADVTDAEAGQALTELWGEAKPATWNRNRAGQLLAGLVLRQAAVDGPRTAGDDAAAAGEQRRHQGRVTSPDRPALPAPRRPGRS